MDEGGITLSGIEKQHQRKLVFLASVVDSLLCLKACIRVVDAQDSVCSDSHT